VYNYGILTVEMENKNTQAFREIIILLLESSLILSFKEKEEFTSLLPMLDQGELMELFGLLVNSKKHVDDIVGNLVNKYPQVVRQLSSYQKNALRSIFKYERALLKTKLN